MKALTTDRALVVNGCLGGLALLLVGGDQTGLLRLLVAILLLGIGGALVAWAGRL